MPNKRASDQDAALEKAFVEAKLPEEDRRAPESDAAAASGVSGVGATSSAPARFPLPPAEGPQVKIRELATGHVFATTPVDGREAVEHPKGGFEYAPADAAVTELEADGTVKKAPEPAPEAVDESGTGKV